MLRQYLQPCSILTDFFCVHIHIHIYLLAFFQLRLYSTNTCVRTTHDIHRQMLSLLTLGVYSKPHVTQAGCAGVHREEEAGHWSVPQLLCRLVHSQEISRYVCASTENISHYRSCITAHKADVLPLQRRAWCMHSIVCVYKLQRHQRRHKSLEVHLIDAP